MNPEKYFDQIEAYLNQELSETDAKAFEQAVENDTELQQAMDIHMLSRDAMDILVENDLRAELNELRAEQQTEAAPATIRQLRPRRRLFTQLAVAASVALAVGFFSFFWASNNYTDEAIAFAAYDNPVQSTTIRGNQGVQQQLKSVKNQLANQEIAAAIATLEKIENGAENSEVQYYLGHAQFLNKDYSTAAGNFQQAIAINDARYKQKAEYYLLLSWMLEGQTNTTAFQTLYDKIAQDDNHYGNKKLATINQKRNSFWAKLVR